MQTRAAITHKMGGTSTNFNGEETTRRSAPRPSGAALRALSPLRCCYGRLIQADENLPNIWRRGWDSNPRTRLGVTHFPGVRLRPLGHLSINLNLLQPPGGIAATILAAALRADAFASSKIAPGDFVEPTNTVRCYTISRRAPATARPPLHAPARVPEATRTIKFTALDSAAAVAGAAARARAQPPASRGRPYWPGGLRNAADGRGRYPSDPEGEAPASPPG